MKTIPLLIMFAFIFTPCFSIAKLKIDCNNQSNISLTNLIKCNGKPTKIIQSSDKNFDFVYWGKGPWTEYVYDKLRNSVCSYGPVNKMKTIMDEPDCYPCGDSDC